MAEIAAKKLYVGDELVYEKPEMKFIYVDKNIGGGTDGVLDMSPQSPDLPSENITITVIGPNNNTFTKTFKTSEWLKGDQKLIGDLDTGKVIENRVGVSSYFEVNYVKTNKLMIKCTKGIAIIIYTL